jgi:hypothetical protein
MVVSRKQEGFRCVKGTALLVVHVCPWTMPARIGGVNPLSCTKCLSRNRRGLASARGGCLTPFPPSQTVLG